MALRSPDWLEAADAELAIGFSSLNRRILSTYERSYANVSRELDGLRAKIAAATEIPTITGSGAVQRGLPPSWILQQERYVRLQSELRGLVVELSDELGRTVPPAMRRAYELGLQSAENLVGPVDPRVVPQSYASVPDEAIRRFLASSSQDADRFLGSPLAKLLDTFRTDVGDSAAQYARDVLTNGLARGRALRSVAAELEQGIRGMTAARALTIARTETLRAHREAHFQSYKANPGIVSSWIWTAAVANYKRPPCAACFAKHGSEHPLEERMETHPNCRCRMIPRRKPFRGIEPTGPATKIQPGSVVIRTLPPGVARRVLGPARHRAFVTNQVSLDDLASYGRANAWGRTLRVTPLRELGLDRFGNRLPTSPKVAPPATIPAKMDRAALDAKIRGVEDEIVQNRKFETAVVFDDAGNIVLDKRGAAFEVNFTDAETASMRGATLVHNHPRAYERPKSDGTFARGSSLSSQDVLFSGRNGIPRIRAVSPGWRHDIEWGSSWTGSSAQMGELAGAIQKSETIVRAELQAEVRALSLAENKRRIAAATAVPRRSTVPTEEYEAAFARYSSEAAAAEAALKDAIIEIEFRHYDEVWKLVERQTGFFRYTREER